MLRYTNILVLSSFYKILLASLLLIKVFEESLEKLEAHLWNCHLREFPYRCALCGYPSLSSKALCLHFEQMHGRNEVVFISFNLGFLSGLPTVNSLLPKSPVLQPVLFKRSIANEMRLREMIAQSLLFPMEENIYDSVALPNGDDESLGQIPVIEQNQVHHIMPVLAYLLNSSRIILFEMIGSTR